MRPSPAISATWPGRLPRPVPGRRRSRRAAASPATAGSRDATALAAIFHGAEGRSCTDCHSFHDPQELKAVDVTFRHDFGSTIGANHCVSCHRPGVRLETLSQGHRAAAALYHEHESEFASLTPSQGCLLCHSRSGGDPAALRYAAEAPPRFEEHASHPYGEVLARGRDTGGFSVRRDPDPRILLFDDRIECQTCHDLASGAQDALVRFDERDGLCYGCHRRDGAEPSRDRRLAAAAPSYDAPDGGVAGRTSAFAPRP